MVIGADPVWRIGFGAAGIALVVGGATEGSVALMVMGALMASAAAYVERWEFDRNPGVIRHVRGLGVPFRTKEYTVASLAAVRVVRTSGRRSEAADDPSVSGDRFAGARAYRRGFAKVSVVFDDGSSCPIQIDSLRSYPRLVAAARAIAEYTGAELRDE